jgi:TPR repeat protein
MAEAEAAMAREEYAAARQLLEEPVREGNAAAEDMLGHMLLFGRGGAKDAVRAEDLLRRAAEKDRPEAQNSIGVLYMTGMSGVIDPVLGVAWFRKAAARGNPYAMFNMGRAAEQDGSLKNPQREALAWYAKAVLKGNEEAKIRIQELRGAQAPKNRNLFYQLDAANHVSQRPLHGLGLDPAPKPGQGGRTQSVGLAMHDARLSRNKQAVALSLKLVNTARSEPLQGELRLALLLPDNSRIPLKAANTAFSVRNFMIKNLDMTLPAETPGGSRILIEALTGGRVLHTSRLALPKP